MLIFISDSLMTTTTQRLLKIYDFLPISIGIAEGKMWSITPDTMYTQGQKPWGGNNIFGMIYYLPDNNFYLRKLDAFYDCSLSALLNNHIRDMNHRKKINVIPIAPITLDDLSRHKYKLRNPMQVWGWVANQNNPHVLNRIKYDQNRIRPGANVKALKEAYRLLRITT